MARWQYRIVDSNDVSGEGLFGQKKTREAIEDYLNKLGAEGWEIVNLDSLELEGRKSFVGVAKRPA